MMRAMRRREQRMDVTSLIGLNWSALHRAAKEFDSRAPDAFDQATGWYAHPAWEVRFFAVTVLGRLATSDDRALPFLFHHCGNDPAWQVNEALAVAFDDWCAATGYQEALPVIQEWLQASNPNLRRAVSEGLRPWTAAKRAYFASNPNLAIDLLGMLKDDDSRYVQESVGNAMRDIARKHFPLVLEAIQAWVMEKPESQSRRTIARFALKHAVKQDPTLRSLYHPAPRPHRPAHDHR
jgi:3-methyladenine DNA glycosylase AlkC